METGQQSIASFFGRGGKGVKFPTIGTTVTGTIQAIHPPEPQTDIKTGEPIQGKTQVRIELATDERDPEIDFDDGSRTLYVRGWMKGAITDALRKAGVPEPQLGAKLTVTYSGDGERTRPGFDPPKQYTAVYVPTASAVEQHFASTEGNGAPVRPDAISQAAWDQMDTKTRADVARTMSNVPF